MAIVVVGIGADGWQGLPATSRAELESCDVVLGGRRQLDLVPDGGYEKRAWPSPLLPSLADVLADARRGGARVIVLASGDPLRSGIGTTLLSRLGAREVRIVPWLSSETLARARLGWSAETTEVVSVVGRDVRRVLRVAGEGRRALVLSSGAHTPADLARLLTDRGFGASELTVLEELGGEAEHRVDGTARDWAREQGAALNVVAVAFHGPRALPAVGLPDEVFDNDGQLTKRDVRAATLARLAPAQGELLWDVGAGAGSVAIEWARSHPANRAVAVESRPDRAERIARNAGNLGVPELAVVTGSAPAALADLDPPDAVFVGGGVSTPGVLETCLATLRPGGRLVANAVTLDAEQTLARAYAEHGGELTRLALERAAPLGGLTGWTPARTVTQWSTTR